MENIIKKSKEIHKNNVDKGFWDNQTPESRIYECLALIHSEISEALEAHRKNRWADLEQFRREREFYAEGDFKLVFEDNIKESVEDELADTAIRILDLLGALKGKIDYTNPKIFIELYEFSYLIYQTHKKTSNVEISTNGSIVFCLADIIEFLESISILLNIDLERHIELKLQYNKLRGYKHGKNY